MARPWPLPSDVVDYALLLLLCFRFAFALLLLCFCVVFAFAFAFLLCFSFECTFNGMAEKSTLQVVNSSFSEDENGLQMIRKIMICYHTVPIFL